MDQVIPTRSKLHKGELDVEIRLFWAKGFDTMGIAHWLGLREAEIYNRLATIKNQAGEL